MKFEELVKLSRAAESNETQVSGAKRAETFWTNYTPQLTAESVSKACFGVFIPVVITPATKYINGAIPQFDWGIQKVA